MEPRIPTAVVDAVTEIISRRGAGCITGFKPLSGGCINHGGQLQTSGGDFFLKWNLVEGLSGMFRAESRGLTLLRSTRAIHVPEVIAAAEAGPLQFLLLEYIERQPRRNDYWTVMGHQLAALHREHGSSYGLDHDNYIGSLPQSNTPEISWNEFFASRRLRPLVESALRTGKAPAGWAQQFERLINRLGSLLPEEGASLVHGDLWQGNVLVNTIGAPCLIDPAVHYAHREVDLAMTKLFGEFDSAFYDAYRDAYPLLPGYGERLKIYNLYPLLVHLLLFGATYVAPIQSTLNAFA